jgi:hypothetical protein
MTGASAFSPDQHRRYVWPTQIAQHFEFGIGNIGGDDKIDRQLSEPLQFVVGMVHDMPLCGIVVVKQYTPHHICSATLLLSYWMATGCSSATS